MTDVVALLPATPTGPFERAMAAGMSDDLPVPYAQILNPYDTPVIWLPWLAAHHAVDLWFDDWPEARKREMIAQCAGVSTVYPDDPPLGELKGTLKGLKRYLEFVDATIVDRKGRVDADGSGEARHGDREDTGHALFRHVRLETADLGLRWHPDRRLAHHRRLHRPHPL